MRCGLFCVFVMLSFLSVVSTNRIMFLQGKKKGGVVVIFKISQNEFPHRLVGRGCNANTDATQDASVGGDEVWALLDVSSCGKLIWCGCWFCCCRIKAKCKLTPPFASVVATTLARDSSVKTDCCVGTDVW